MKRIVLLLAVVVILFAVPVLACDTNPYCKDGDQFTIGFINGNMITITFDVKVPGTYRFDYVIKNLKGIPVKRGHVVSVLDCSYGGRDGKTMVYIYLKGRPLKPLTNYMFEVTESITTSPEWFEEYYVPWEGD